MLLALDVGNSDVSLGLFAGEDLERTWRVTTRPDRTADEWAVLLRALFEEGGLDITEVSGSVLCSVVPTATEAVAEALMTATGTSPVVVGADSPLPVRLEVDEPASVGADRVVNTLAASRLFGLDTIIADFGTATTLDCVTAEGAFLGGIIAPGLLTSAESLVRRAAKLSATELTPPVRAIGRRTDECLRAGLIFGAADAVDGMVRRIKAEWPSDREPKVVATGGLGSLVAKFSSEIEEVHPDLTLRGLRLAYLLLTDGQDA